MTELDNVRSLLYEEGDEEPVKYCINCLSLAIKILSEDEDYCDMCGSTNTESTDIYTWETMYEQKYGKNYLKD